jgi:hypothetical protein
MFASEPHLRMHQIYTADLMLDNRLMHQAIAVRLHGGKEQICTAAFDSCTGPTFMWRLTDMARNGYRGGETPSA